MNIDPMWNSWYTASMHGDPCLLNWYQVFNLGHKKDPWGAPFGMIMRESKHTSKVFKPLFLVQFSPLARISCCFEVESWEERQITFHNIAQRGGCWLPWWNYDDVVIKTTYFSFLSAIMALWVVMAPGSKEVGKIEIIMILWYHFRRIEYCQESRGFWWWIFYWAFIERKSHDLSGIVTS